MLAVSRKTEREIPDIPFNWEIKMDFLGEQEVV